MTSLNYNASETGSEEGLIGAYGAIETEINTEADDDSINITSSAENLCEGAAEAVGLGESSINSGAGED